MTAAVSPCVTCTLAGRMNETAKTGIDAEKLLAVVAAVAKEARPHVEPRVSLDSSLEKELGLDSLARVELVLRLAAEHKIPVTPRGAGSGMTGGARCAVRVAGIHDHRAHQPFRPAQVLLGNGDGSGHHEILGENRGRGGRNVA